MEDAIDLKTILIIDNDVAFNNSTAVKIKSWGYNVQSVYTGENAVELFAQTIGLHLVLMDIDLGNGMDGACTALQILARRKVPIVFLTDHTESGMVEKINRIPRYGYVVKSSGEFVLRSSIEMAFVLFESKQETKRQLTQSNAILKAIPDLFFLIDRDGFFHDFYDNSSVLKNLLPLNKIIGAHLKDILPPEETVIQLAVYRKCFDTGESQTYTYKLDVDGKPQYFDLRVSRFDEKRVMVLVRNITERKEIEELLRENEEKYRLVFEHSPLGLLAFDQKGCVTACNQNFAKIIGSPRSRLLGLNMLELPDTHLLAAVCRALTGNDGFYEDEYHSVTAAKVTPVRILFAPIKLGNGEIHGGVGIVEDITERRMAEQKLRESEERFRRITAGLNDYLYTVKIQDGKAVETIHNEACTTVTGYSIRDFTYDPYLWINMVVPEERELVAQRFSRILEGNDLPTFEHRIICKDGTIRWISDTCIPKYNSKGILVSYDGVIKDITERKLIEEKIKALLSEKELILKEVHHRIKNNMNTINSLLNLQASTLKDAAAITALEDAGRRVRSMMMLYEKLYQAVDVSEISASQYLPSLIDQVVANFPNARIVKIDKKIDNFVLDVKKMQPVGIIVNELLTNIMKYAFNGRDSGLITVSASLNGSMVSVIIEDNGLGIPESVSFQKSTGFGLMLVNVLTQQLKGSIRIERGNGTKIILEFVK